MKDETLKKKAEKSRKIGTVFRKEMVKTSVEVIQTKRELVEKVMRTRRRTVKASVKDTKK